MLGALHAILEVGRDTDNEAEWRMRERLIWDQAVCNLSCRSLISTVRR